MALVLSAMAVVAGLVTTFLWAAEQRAGSPSKVATTVVSLTALPSVQQEISRQVIDELYRPLLAQIAIPPETMAVYQESARAALADPAVKQSIHDAVTYALSVAEQPNVASAPTRLTVNLGPTANLIADVMTRTHPELAALPRASATPYELELPAGQTPASLQATLTDALRVSGLVFLALLGLVVALCGPRLAWRLRRVGWVLTALGALTYAGVAVSERTTANLEPTPRAIITQLAQTPRWLGGKFLLAGVVLVVLAVCVPLGTSIAARLSVMNTTRND